jgi:hypothetical protein
MQLNLAKCFALQLGKARFNNQVQWKSVRAFATVKEIFQNKSEFPSRHIGPRKTDVVSMLDLLGFKVTLKELI